MSKINLVDDNNFDVEVLQSTTPVLVEFGAEWCAPCHKQLPILEKFAEDNSDKLKIVKMDIDESPKTTSKFSIKSVPTLMLFNLGKKMDSKVGLTPATVLHKMILDKLV